MRRMLRTDQDRCPHCFSTRVERIDVPQYQPTPPGWLFRCLDPNCGRAYVKEVPAANKPPREHASVR
jgi:hypothetical protein